VAEPRGLDDQERSEPAAWRERRRWRVCVLLFVITIVSYIDRQTLSIAAPAITSEFKLSNSYPAYIVNAFPVAYRVGQLFAGRFMDWIGAKLGFVAVVLMWSVASALTSLGCGVWTLSAFRGLLGLAEGGNFPGGVKVIAQWFGPKERSTAVGLFTSGASIGAIITPPLVAFLIVTVGWRLAFVITALPGLLWIWLWLKTYSNVSARVAAAPQRTSREWRTIFRSRAIWGVFLARFLEEPVSWFYLTWLPLYMRNYREASITDIGLALIVPYVALDIGYILGGWSASRLIKAGWSLSAARKTVMVLSAICMVAGIPAVGSEHTWGFVIWVSVATFGHGGWASNIITLPGDFAPPDWVGTVYGITAFGGGLGAILFTQLTGYLVDTQQSFNSVFLIGGLLPLVAAAVILTVPGRFQASSSIQTVT
jgi:ACS family hexuronate transporter-like MFS transporter